MASLSDDKAETIELHERFACLISLISPALHIIINSSSMLSHVDDDVTLLRGARNPSANFMKV